MSSVAAEVSVAQPTPHARAAGATSASARARRGMFEFLAVGGVTLFAFPLSWWAQRYAGLDASEYAVGFATFYAAFVVNDPHFSVTYLLFYRGFGARLRDPSRARPARLRDLLAGVVAPVLMIAWSVTAIALRSAATLGALIELMFALVGWHYAKQGFGVLAVLSARRGVRFDANERRALLVHCYSAWAFAWSNPARAAIELEEKGVAYVGVAHPRWLELVTGSVLAASSVWLVLVLLRKWRREQSLPALPLAAFLITIWLWTIYTQLDPLVRYVIPALHSVQYLCFVAWLKRNEAREREAPPLFGPPVRTQLATLALCALALGWLLFHGAPDALDSAWRSGKAHGQLSAALGATPWFAACYAIVNLHHYFMDAVIWRRDHPAARYLG